jgi:DNA-binding transcriptional ArsR family regulator
MAWLASGARSGKRPVETCTILVHNICAWYGSGMTQPPATTLRLDSGALQVLAHPLRSRLLGALRTGGPATATTLAATLGTNTGATSYHLRKLGSVGLVEEADLGRGRERWWRAATEMHGWTERDVADDPDGRAATDWLRRYYLRAFVDRYETWLDSQADWSLDWQDAAGASDYAVHVSPARLAAFTAEFAALVERYRASVGDDDAETVRVQLHAFPLAEGVR